MKKSILKEYTKIGLQEYLAEKDKDFIDSFADKECSADFAKEIAKRLRPLWKDIYDYEYGGFWKRLLIRIKAILKSRRGECNVPKDVIESLAETFLPEIRAFFESEEGRKEFKKWNTKHDNTNKVV